MRSVSIFPMRGIANIIIGGVFIYGGLSGTLVLNGTHSGQGLALVGAGLVALGIYRMTRTS